MPRLDLPYEEDVRAETDMNVVMTGDGAFVEVQGTAEGAPFDRAELDALLGARREGLRRPDPAAAGGARRDEPQVFLASRNAKKLAEMRADPAPSTCPTSRCSASTTSRRTTSRSRTEPTFEGNALLKARAGLAATGLPSLADDSGLCVDALNGMPGRALGALGRARRRTTTRNNRLLLDQLADVPDERRGAHFTCAVAFCHPGRRRERVVDGRDAPAGSSARRGGAAASATTCSSWPTTSAGASPPPS